jgi:large subunit ribosomal protein L17
MALVGLVEDEIVVKAKKGAADTAKSDAVSMVEGEGKSA